MRNSSAIAMVLISVGLALLPAARASGPTRSPAPRDDDRAAVTRIPVKILVDQYEPGIARVWEERLRKRVWAASEILERQCGVKLEVVAAERWEADPRISTLQDLADDFESKVKPEPARLAIGFANLPGAAAECTRLSTPRAALHSHILVSEWFPRATERQRLEALLHELGHVLGAVHSPQSDSVMRPVVGDNRSLSPKFRINCDAENASAIGIVAAALSARDVRRLDELDAETKRKLVDIYGELNRRLPTDPVAASFLTALRDPPRVPVPAEQPKTLVESTRWIVSAIVQAAQRQFERPEHTTKLPRGAGRVGDVLAEDCFRVAAIAATQVAPEHAVKAFLLALGIAIDDSEVLRENPLTREFCHAIESDAERADRIKVLGSSTMRGRRDWAQHFVVSAALTARYGTEFAEAAGLFKEMNDMRGDSGFSFADVAADFAGIAFAREAQRRPANLTRWAKSFVVHDYIADPRNLPDGLSQEQFQRDFGSASDERFLAAIASIRERIRELPAYRDFRGDATPSSQSL